MATIRHRCLEPIQIKKFCEHLQTRNYSSHTVENYGRDLRLFFAELGKNLREVSWRDVDHFVQQQARDGLAATTVNWRLNAIKHFFDYLVIEQQLLGVNPVKPSHFLQRGRLLPKKLSQEQVKRLFARIENPMDHALCLLMLRCGLRVSEVAKLKLSAIDWEQKSLLVEQGKGRKDRVVYLSSDAIADLKACLELRPASVPDDLFFWNQKRLGRALSTKGMDGSEEADVAVEEIASRNWPDGSEVRIVNSAWTLPPARDPGTAINFTEWIAQETERVRKIVDGAAEKLGSAGLQVSTVVKEQEPKALLCIEVEDLMADSIFVGARGMGRLERFLICSVSLGVAARAHCSVEVVRTENKA